ncbi:polyketide synthase [Wenjunlia vitaminophila]|uniref:Polyketide synthase n=1 Tax=Wenjunlia vitaminophila TaxID=76728 RepID=A0A0T6LXJ9_WENVI|nr:type I polyketide synthase [Wenjunlia vitaminophila]KRV50594.1 polyketide synthase [Wenjunlia vitaminophila]
MTGTNSQGENRRAVIQQALDTIERLERRALAAEGRLTEPVAVIGLGCRLPGEVDGPQDYWRLLAEGRDGVVEVPASRWDAARFLCDDFTVPGTIRSGSGGFLTHWDPASFDASFFGISPREAVAMDPQQRLLMEVVWEALEHAGLPADRLHGTRGGVFVGITLHEYAVRHFQALGPQDVDAYTVTGGVHNAAAGRIAYHLGLHGPAVAVDTACSSSLTAVHLACQSLRTGDADLAFAAGTNLMLMPESSISLSRFGTLAPDGRCKAYDASADGLGRGEGCGVVVLKRLADAERDGDRVLAVVRGTAVNQDGASSGPTVPNGLAHEDVIRTALDRSGLGPRDIDYVEGHGTGTPLGDPIELEALASVFVSDRDPDRPLLVGSAKTNLGHTEATAGVAGLIKSVLALHHRHIPPHLHLTERTHRISERAARIEIPAQGQPWPDTGRPARAGVSAFGISGTNAHVVLEQAASSGEAPAHRHGGPLLFQLSGATPAGLRANAERLADWLGRNAEASPVDVAHTLGRRRTHLPHRAAVVADSLAGLGQELKSLAAGETTPGAVTAATLPSAGEGAVWVFSGQGSQWTGMGRELLATEPAFAEVVHRLEPVVAAESGLSLVELLCDRDLTDAPLGHLQPAVFAMQVGLAEVWRAHGAEPAAVLGHSMGEVAAAVVSGALELEDGARAICRRSRLYQERFRGSGLMALVELPTAEVHRRLAGHDGVSVAVSASPRSTVVGGGAAEVRRLVEAWQGEGLLAKLVPGVSVPAHTPQVEPLLPELRALLADLAPREPRVTFYSTAHPDPHTTPVCDADYWAANMRNPVRFTQTVAAAAADGFRVFVEVSPHPVVTHSVSETLAAEGVDDVLVTGTLRRGEPAGRTLLVNLGQLHCHGAPVDLARLHPHGTLTDLPTNAWQHERFWFDTDGGGAQDPAAHPLLGTRVLVPGSPVRHVWQTELSPRRLPWLEDHRVAGSVVVPGTAYCEAALAAGCQALAAEPDALELHDVEYRSLLVLDGPTVVTTELTETGAGCGRVEVRTRDGEGAWTTHAVAGVRPATGPRPPAQDPAGPGAPHHTEVPAERLYAWMRAAGQQHGPAFQGVESALVDPEGRSAVGRVTVPEQARVGLPQASLHPVLLDLCMQLLAAVPAADASRPAGGDALLPVRVGSLRRWAAPETGGVVHSRLAPHGPDGGLLGDVTLLDDGGRVVVEARNVEVVRVPRESGGHPLDDRVFELSWEAVPPVAADTEPPGGSWLLLTEPGGAPLAERLREGLTSAGRPCPLLDSAAGPAALAGAITAAVSSGEPLRGVVVVMPPAEDDERLLTGAPETALDQARLRVARLTELVGVLGQTAEGSAEHPAPRLWVVTHGAHPVGAGDPVSPAQSALRGMVRTLGYEHPALRATLLDLGPGAEGGTGASSVLAELLADPAQDDIALRDGQRYLTRFTPAPLSDRARPAARRTARYGADGFRLTSRTAGRLDALELTAFDRRPPGPGEVEVRVAAAGLNFSDTLKAMGVYQVAEGDDRPMLLGTECAGEISAVGEGVTGLRVGDRVAASGWGCFGTFLTTRADLVTPLPEGMTAAGAATVPSVFVTAWYGLHHVARVAAGEHVLVHSGTGGVGMAAIAIARAAGAEVHATAGTPAKRDLLRRMGVRHVSDSRTLAWADDVLAATGGRGVDVVLNSLTGPALHRGVEVLAEHGRFVEIGKRDIHQDARLGMLPFSRGITFAAVDADLLARTRPAVMRRVLDEVFAEFAAGRLEPLPHTEWPLERAADAFRTMANAEHTGKLVITVPASGTTEVVQEPGTVPLVREGGGYLVTGGLSGLGLFTAGHLVDEGAGAVVLNGRSEPSGQALEAIERMRAAGARVSVVLGDIAAEGTAERMVAAVRESGAPLRGVVHSAVVLDDCLVADLDAERLERVWRPKVVGAWRLHRATEDLDLDWWVGFSSTSGVLGSAGQAGYAAASAWLDGLAHWRRARGLPALSVDWGPWSGIGLAQDLDARGYRLIEPQDGTAALSALVSHRRAQTTFASFHPDEWFRGHPAVAASSVYAGADERTADTGQSAPLLARIAGVGEEPEARRLLEAFVSEQVRGVLRRDQGTVDLRAPIASFGMDSLMALELRNRLEGGTGLKLSAALVWSHRDLASLVEDLAGRLGLAPPPPPAPGSGAGGDTAATRPVPAAEEPPAALSAEDTDVLAQILAAMGPEQGTDGHPAKANEEQTP